MRASLKRSVRNYLLDKVIPLRNIGGICIPCPYLRRSGATDRTGGYGPGGREGVAAEADDGNKSCKCQQSFDQLFPPHGRSSLPFRAKCEDSLAFPKLEGFLAFCQLCAKGENKVL